MGQCIEREGREREREGESGLSRLRQLNACVKKLTDVDRISHSEKATSSMHTSDIIEYTSRRSMEETTAKVFARLHRMKSVLYRTFKRKSPCESLNALLRHHPLSGSSCGTIPNRDGTYISSHDDESAQTSQYFLETDEDVSSPLPSVLFLSTLPLDT